jgi:hypothetical protein
MSGAREAIAIFDAIAELGRLDALAFRRLELRESIRHAESTCGSCAFWMTDLCPLETLHKDGFKRGPHMNYPKCGKFQMKAVSIASVAGWQREVNDIDAKLGGPHDPRAHVAAAMTVTELAYADLVEKGLERDWSALTPVLLIPLRAIVEAHAKGLVPAATLRTVAGETLDANTEMRNASNVIEREALAAIALAEIATKTGNN